MPVRPSSPFVVPLRDIPPEGKQLRLSADEAFVREAVAGEPLSWAADPADAPRYEMTLHKTGREVHAHGQLAGAVMTDCSRCTVGTRIPLDETFDLTFVPAEQAARDESKSAGEREIGPGEAEQCTYVDEEIDLTVPLREQLILALPYAPLCREDCRGLCPRCGNDRNTGACTCPAEAIEADPVKPSPFAALKNIKL